MQVLSIEDAIAAGEYDQGLYVAVDYDELYDLVEQAKLIAQGHGGGAVQAWNQRAIELRSNRPLHPCLGGKSPYSEFLPL